MKKIKIKEILFPSTSFVSDPIAREDDEGFSINMEFEGEDSNVVNRVIFERPRAYRKIEAIYCSKWHIEDVYDCVCEVPNSIWVDELKANAPSDLKDAWEMHHFMIYLDSFGCVEVIAKGVRLE